MQEVVLKELQTALNTHSIVLEQTLDVEKANQLRNQQRQLFEQMDRLVNERLTRQDSHWLEAIDSLKKHTKSAQQANQRLAQHSDVIHHAANVIRVLDKVLTQAL